MRRLTRREFTATILGLAGAGLLASCSSPAPTAPPTAAPTQPPTAAPKPTTAPAAAPTSAPAAAAASPAATTAPASKPALQSIKLAFVSPSAANSAIWSAKDGGFLEKYGLDAELININNSAQAVPSLLAGDTPINCGLSTTEPIASAIQGSDLVLVATNVNTIPSSVMVVPSIKTVADLKGKRIAVSRFGSASDTAARIFLKKNGLDPEKDATLVQAGGQNEILGAVQGGSADAGVLSPPVTMLARKAGYSELVDLGKLGIEYAFNGVVTTRKYLKEQPQTVENVLKAMIEGLHKFKTDKTFGMAVITNYAKLDDPAVAEDTWQTFLPYLLDKPFPTDGGVKTVLGELSASVPKAADANPKDFYDDSIVRKLETQGFYTQLGIK